jgi:two-component system, NarL family, response regulator LiaR
MQERGPVRIAVLNDYDIVVAGVAAVLRPFSDRVEVVDLAAGGAERTRLHEAELDLVLYDTFGRSQGGALNIAGMTSKRIRVVVFSWNTDPALVAASLEAGAAGYVAKSATADELVSAIERIAAGQRVVPDGTDGRDGFDGFGRWPGDEHGLSPREAEVLALICQGLSNEEIGQRAFIGVNTVKTHIRTLYRKINVSSRTQAVVWGHAHGFQPEKD